MSNRSYRHWAAALLLLGLLAACGPMTGAPAQPSATPPATHVPTQPAPTSAPTTAPTHAPTRAPTVAPTSAPAQSKLPRDQIWVLSGAQVLALPQGNPAVTLATAPRDLLKSNAPIHATRDGTALLYTTLVLGGGPTELNVFDVTSGQTHILERDQQVLSPRFSPDGRSVAYLLIASSGTPQRWELVSQEWATGTRRVLTQGTLNPRERMTLLAPVRWTPNGLFAEKILYGSDAPPQGLQRIDAQPVTVYDKDYLRVSLSADGRAVALLTGVMPYPDQKLKSSLLMLDTASGKTSVAVRDSAQWIPTHRVSPSGKQIAYTTQSNLESPVRALHLVNADGTNARTLNIAEGAIRDVRWRGDDALLVLVALPNQTLRLSQVALSAFSAAQLQTLGTLKDVDAQDVYDLIAYVPPSGAMAVGKYISFAHPEAWKPTQQQPFGGAVLETWKLGIPGVESDQTLGFSAVTVAQARPKDISAESDITIGGKPGKKWLRTGSNYVSYDYITTGYQNQGSFSVHVTVSKADAALERELDKLVQSIVFNP